MKQLIKGLIFVIAIYYLSQQYYKQGANDFMRNTYQWYTPTTYIQDPPTIMTDCYQACLKVEHVTWEEYVKRYQERMKPQ